MIWLHLIVFIFSALTLFYTYSGYKQKQFSKKAFVIICFLETVVILTTSILLILSL